MDAPWIVLLPRSIADRFRGNAATQAMASNAAWLGVDKFARLLIAVPVTFLVARHLGTEAFGTLNFAISFISLFSVLASAGLDQIVIRALVSHPKLQGRLLGTALALKLGFAGLALILALVTNNFTTIEDKHARLLVQIVSISLLFQSADVFDFWFQATLASKQTVLARLIALALATFLRISCIWLGLGVSAFAWIVSAEAFASAAFLLFAARRASIDFRGFLFRRAIFVGLIKNSWPLLISSVAVILYMRIDVVMLEYMKGPKEVGLYAAATRVSELWYAIPMILCASAFPSLIRSRALSQSGYLQRLGSLYFLLTWLAVLIALPLSLASNWLVNTFYGASFSAAGIILAVHLWASIPVFLGVASNQFLLVENLQHISLYRSLIGLASNVVLNVFLIPTYGALGAAVATLISYCLSVGALAFFPGSRRHALHLVSSVFKRPRL